LKNLTKLHTLDISLGVAEVPSCVKDIPNLKKLIFNGEDVPIQSEGNATAGNNTNQPAGNNTNQPAGNNANQPAGNNANQPVVNNVNQPAGNDVNQAIGNNNDQIAGNITNGNTTTTEPNGDINVDSAAGSTIVHAINYLPVIALIFGMLL